MEQTKMTAPEIRTARPYRIVRCLTNFLVIILALLLASCTVFKPPIKTIYEPYATLERNPVIVIPGIKGSELKNIEKDRTVWGGWWQFSKSDFDDLELKIGAPDSYEIFNVESNVKATNIFSRWRILGFLHESTEIDIYGSLIDTMVKYGGYKNANVKIEYDAYGNLTGLIRDKDTNPEGNLFIFYYDWRRDNVLNAVNLERFITKVQEQFFPNNKDVKFNIVAHSMGGLITRFYLGYQPFCAQAATGKKKIYGSIAGEDADMNPPKGVGKVVLLGTPRGGALEPLGAYITGEGMETLSKKDVKRIVVTWPSVYQLLPPACTQAHLIGLDEKTRKALQGLDNSEACKPDEYRYSLLNPATWKELQWSAFNPAWDPRNRDDKQRLITKALNRAQEFFGALHKSDSNPHLKRIIKLMGGDCMVTLHRGMVEGNVILLKKEDMEQKIGVTRKEDLGEEAGKSRYYHVPWDLRRYFSPGDGQVPRESMLTGLPGADTLFVCGKHSALFKDVTLQNNLLYELLLKDNPAYKKLFEPM